MNPWINLLFGSPRRTLVGLAVLGFISVVITGMVAPQLIHAACARLNDAFAPLIKLLFEALLTAFFVLVGMRLLWNAVFKHGGGKK